MAYHFENIKLEKGMYGRSGRSFSQALEELDPSEHYRGTPLEGLDAFQRQLKRFDIKVRGAASDPVEKFFRTADSAVLFPEYIARSVRQGMEEGDLLPSITAATTRFEGMDYRSITAQAGGDSKELKAVGDIFITGIVGSCGSFDPLMLQSIRLSVVMRMADCISRSIYLVEKLWENASLL